MTSTPEGVYGLFSQDIWDKTCTLIDKIHSMESEISEGMNGYKLYSIRELLIYFTRTYRHMKTYLGILYITMDSCKPYRDEK